MDVYLLDNKDINIGKPVAKILPKAPPNWGDNFPYACFLFLLSFVLSIFSIGFSCGVKCFFIFLCLFLINLKCYKLYYTKIHLE